VWPLASSRRRSAEPEKARSRRVAYFASITTRSSTRPLTCNISRGNAGLGSGFNWRYDSGQVAGAIPFAGDSTTPVDLTGLTADQQLQAGLFCGTVHPTLASPLRTCSPSQYGSTLVSLPAPGTENPDRNPPRISPRHLFDVAVGEDNLFHGDKYKWSLQLTAINVTNRVVLYNFLSTFSGTHYVSPRALTAELGFHF
jgi:hypothetical protein